MWYLAPLYANGLNHVVDKVEFTSAFDKKLGQLVALNIRVIESAKEEEEVEATGPVERRAGTETGIIACVSEQRFGFVQGNGG